MKVSEDRIFVSVKQLYSVMVCLLFHLESIMVEISPVSEFHPVFVGLLSNWICSKLVSLELPSNRMAMLVV